MELGVCRSVDPDLFYAHEDVRGRGLLAQENSAKKVCGTCYVQAECLAYALEKNEKFGVWGGTTARERLRMRRSNKVA